jgi:hypothetical protein
VLHEGGQELTVLSVEMEVEAEPCGQPLPEYWKLEMVTPVGAGHGVSAATRPARAATAMTDFIVAVRIKRCSGERLRAE